jgi:hypothetical protein
MTELDEVKRLRLKLKAARALIRDLNIAAARAEEALERHARNPQPEEAQGDHQDAERYAAAI